jgi:hypothetical protein
MKKPPSTARKSAALGSPGSGRDHAPPASSPNSWRRAQNVGQDIGLAGAHLEQAIRDAENVGFIERRADDASVIHLYGQGAGSGIAIAKRTSTDDERIRPIPLLVEQAQRQRKAL